MLMSKSEKMKTKPAKKGKR